VNLYLDTSSLLKLYLIEDGTESVRGMVSGASLIATSRVSIAEGRGSLARALRGNRLAEERYPHADTEFRHLIDSLRLMDVEESLAWQAGELAAEHFLRGLDAIHLASALVLQEAIDDDVTFSSFDDRLNAAAADCGLTVP
jgi:predicted nucleic acid-binding protein